MTTTSGVLQKNPFAHFLTEGDSSREESQGSGQFRVDGAVRGLCQHHLGEMGRVDPAKACAIQGRLGASVLQSGAAGQQAQIMLAQQRAESDSLLRELTEELVFSRPWEATGTGRAIHAAMVTVDTLALPIQWVGEQFGRLCNVPGAAPLCQRAGEAAGFLGQRAVQLLPDAVVDTAVRAERAFVDGCGQYGIPESQTRKTERSALTLALTAVPAAGLGKAATIAKRATKAGDSISASSMSRMLAAESTADVLPPLEARRALARAIPQRLYREALSHEQSLVAALKAEKPILRDPHVPKFNAVIPHLETFFNSAQYHRFHVSSGGKSLTADLPYIVMHDVPLFVIERATWSSYRTTNRNMYSMERLHAIYREIQQVAASTARSGDPSRKLKAQIAYRPEKLPVAAMLEQAGATVTRVSEMPAKMGATALTVLEVEWAK